MLSCHDLQAELAEMNPEKWTSIFVEIDLKILVTVENIVQARRSVFLAVKEGEALRYLLNKARVQVQRRRIGRHFDPQKDIKPSFELAQTKMVELASTYSGLNQLGRSWMMGKRRKEH